MATKSKAAAKSAKPPASDTSDWREKTLAEIRRLIQAAVPGVVEERKWVKPSNPAGVPVWSYNGIVCTGETYKAAVKLTFARGASLPDPARLFNSSLEGNTRRAIDIHEGEKLNVRAFTALVKAAAAANGAPAKKIKAAAGKTKPAPKAKAVKLLAGGNPQIAKADGDAPVQAYIDAVPGWKRDTARRLDAIITRNVPGVRKAVKWNSPFYGIDGRGWFLSMHVYTNYVKVAFFRGASLRPLPPGESTQKEVRYLDLREGELDEAQFASWAQQAALLPGWNP